MLNSFSGSMLYDTEFFLQHLNNLFGLDFFGFQFENELKL